MPVSLLHGGRADFSCPRAGSPCVTLSATAMCEQLRTLQDGGEEAPRGSERARGVHEASGKRRRRDGQERVVTDGGGAHR